MAGGLTIGRRPWATTGSPAVTDRTARIVAVACLVALNALDVLTTHHVIVGLGGVEGNPLSRWLISHDMLLAAKAGVVMAIGLMAVRLPPRRGTSVALWLVVGFYLAVVLHNTAQIAAAA
jgi:hypothetical protein